MYYLNLPHKLLHLVLFPSSNPSSFPVSFGNVAAYLAHFGRLPVSCLPYVPADHTQPILQGSNSDIKQSSHSMYFWLFWWHWHSFCTLWNNASWFVIYFIVPANYIKPTLQGSISVINQKMPPQQAFLCGFWQHWWILGTLLGHCHCLPYCASQPILDINQIHHHNKHFCHFWHL